MAFLTVNLFDLSTKIKRPGTLVRLKEQTLIVCCKHAKTIVRLSPDDKTSRLAAGKSQQVSGGYSSAELAGEFSDLRSWSQPPAQRGERSLTWRTTELPAGAINSLGGMRALREGMFSLSYFTYGYHGPEDDQIACIYLPLIKAQLELPADDVEGRLGWESRALLNSICGRRDSTSTAGVIHSISVTAVWTSLIQNA